MINLSVGRDLSQMSLSFYNSIKKDLEISLTAKKAQLNAYKTSSGFLLGDYFEGKIKDIITKDLEYLVINVHPELQNLFLIHYHTKKKVVSNLKLIVDSILMFESHDKWQAYKFSRNLGLQCCPYCNRTYITTLGKDCKKFSRPDIDHFLSKKDYPYFRLSFFNLIPSCIICNRNAKQAGKTLLDKNIYPYSEGFDNHTMFLHVPKTYDDAIGLGNPKIKFAYYGNLQNRKKAKANIKLFRLEDQYSMHTYELNHLIKLKELHSEAYIEDLMSKYPGLLKTQAEAYKMAFGKEYDLINDDKRPLSKFTRDILEDLQMLNIFKSK